MKELTLLHHGERVRAEYAPLPGEAEGAMGASTAEERPDGQVSGIVKRYRKDRTAEGFPQALGWIKAVYPEAIEYTGMVKELRGYGFYVAVFFGFVMLVGGGVIISEVFFDLHRYSYIVSLQLTNFLIDLPLGIGFFCFGIWVVLFGLRVDLFKPADLPIIFDRENKKIYRILRAEQPGWRGVFRRWPVMVCEYDWDLVDAEHEAEMVATGSSLIRNHFLMFIVRKSASDPTIIDSFQIANASSLSENLVPAMWEHIRRFMEESGPHLPTPNEPLADLEAPPNWWQSLGATGPFGPTYFNRWKMDAFHMVFMHLALPVTLPMFWLWGTGNWLSYKTAFAVDWPQEVKRRVGAAMKVERADCILGESSLV